MTGAETLAEADICAQPASYDCQTRGDHMNAINIDDFKDAARDILSEDAWNYIAGGSEDEITIRDNALAFSRWRLMPRILRDISKRSPVVSLLGQEVALPVVLAPTSPLRLAHVDAELAAVNAAARSHVLAICSMDSHYSLEDTARADGPLWFQLYCYGDRGHMAEIIKRAEHAGYKALVVTVDAFHPGRRERMLRRLFSMPANVGMGNLNGLELDSTARRPDGSIKRFALTWADLEWLASCTSLPIILKGILSPDDADLAVARGAAAVVVSNHGGRQIDQVPASLDCLAPVVERVGSRAEVYYDGGVRRGTDVLKAMALGASAVLIGRAYIWGLAVAGEEGVSRVIDIFRQEIDVAMAQLGLADLKSIDASFIVPSTTYPGDQAPRLHSMVR